MTTAASSITFTTVPRPTLDELVDRLINSVFGAPEAPDLSLARSVHDARRLRQAGDLDGALAVLAGADLDGATEQESRWTYAEWLGLARRRFADLEGAALYSPGTGAAAVLAPCGDGSTLEVLAVLGMRWPPGKTVSRRSLRGLRPLDGNAS